MPESILLVDDDEILRSRLARAFRERGFEVLTASHVDEAIEVAREATRDGVGVSGGIDKAVVDLRMPGRSGIELIAELQQLNAETQVVVLTGYGSIATAIDAVRQGATYYLPKPADADEILASFDRDDEHPLDTEDEHRAPSLARAEWEHINRVLADCGGNISKAARALGIHRRSLQRKLQKYPPRE